MANYLYKRMNRELRKIKFRAIGSAILIIISVAIYIGFSAMLPIATDALETKVEELQLSDYMVHVVDANDTTIDSLTTLPGVRSVEDRVQLASRLGYRQDGSDHEVTSFLYGIDPVEPPTINSIEMLGDKGRYFSDNMSAQLLLERNFANNEGVKVGDMVTINTARGKVDMEVIGLVMSPEYFFLPINPQSIMPYPGNLAIAWVSMDWLRSTFDLAPDYINEFSFTFDKGQDGKVTQGSINDQLTQNVILFSVPKDQVYGYKLIQEDLSQGEGFIGLFAFLLLAIAFFIVYTSFARIVQEQMREIGILRALGYSRSRVTASYVYMAFLIGSVASIVGIIFGMPFGQYLGSFYVKMMVGTHLESFVFTPDAYIVGFLFGPLTAMLASIVAVWGTVTIEPQNAIRGIPRSYLGRFKRGKRTKNKVGRSAKGSYISHYTLKNMGRHRVRTMITTIAIAGGIMLGAMSLVMMASFQNSLEKSIDDYERWDVLAEFSLPLNETAANTLISSQDILDHSYISRIEGQWSTGGKEGFTVIVGLDQQQELHRFNVKGGDLWATHEQVMVNDVFAKEKGIKTGDTISLTTLGGPMDLRVTALVEDYLGTIYVDMDWIDDLAGETVYNGVYLKIASSKAEAVHDLLMASPLVTDAQTKGTAKGGLFEYMESFSSLLYVMTLLGVAVAAPTLANIVLVGVLERYPEYGQLRAIGYSKWAIAKSIILELMIVVSAGAIIGAPFTYLFVKGYEASYREFFPAYETILYPADWMGYFVTVLIIYLIAFLAAAPSIRKVNRMDISKVVAGGRFG